MKRNLTKVLPVFFVTLVLMLLLYGCRQSVEIINNDNIIVSGKIIDSKTSEPISNAIVKISSYSTQSNKDGSFYFIVKNSNLIRSDSINFSISKGNYAPYLKIIKKADLGLLPSISLIPYNTAVAVGTKGGSITIKETEGVSTDNAIKLTIPEGALATNTDISVTQLSGNNIPGTSPLSRLGVLNAGTVICQPLGTSFNTPAQISISLPVKQVPNSSLALLRFNQATNKWEDSGIKVTVNNEGTSVSGSISDCAIYSIGITGNLIPQSTASDTTVLTKTAANMCFQDSISFPNGISDNISLVWIKNIIYQNISGGFIDFYNSKCYDITNINSSLALRKEQIMMTLTYTSFIEKSQSKYYSVNNIKISPINVNVDIKLDINRLIEYLLDWYRHRGGSGKSK
jgi:hypothetical protein